MSSKAIFVLGPPRSGTTLVGRYLGTGGALLDLGEYGAFYLAHRTLVEKTRRMESPVKDDYLEAVQRHAYDFAVQRAKGAGATGFLDCTPANLLIAGTLARAFREARFVLMVRHYAGHSQALQRSREAGRRWAGGSVAERAKLWASSYAHARELPVGRTFALSYDRLCAAPAETLTALRTVVSSWDVPTGDLDEAVLAESHATSAGRRPTIGSYEGGRISLRPIPSVESHRWSGWHEQTARPIVAPVAAMLGSRFGVDLDTQGRPASLS